MNLIQVGDRVIEEAWRSAARAAATRVYDVSRGHDDLAAEEGVNTSPLRPTPQQVPDTDPLGLHDEERAIRRESSTPTTPIEASSREYSVPARYLQWT